MEPGELKSSESGLSESKLNELKASIEAILFASPEPLSLGQIASLFKPDGVMEKEVSETIDRLRNDYQENLSRGIWIREVAGGFQMVTKPTFATLIGRMQEPKARQLSQAALETMAIIAYRQPIVRSEIEALRGVDSGGVLKTLLEHGLIRIIGRREDPGQPLIYATTPAFLELFNLKELGELPSLREVEEIAGEKIETQNEGDEEQIGDRFAEEEATEETSQEAGPEDEALVELEQNLNKLRKVEKEIFPKPPESETVGAVPTVQLDPAKD